MSNNYSILARFMRGWKRLHMNQVIMLSASTAVLAFLSFFHVYSESADISEINNNVKQPTVIYDQNGEVASKISAHKNEGVSIDQIPDHVKEAVIATEDHRYYDHSGIDLIGISRAFLQNVKAGRIVEGGSTITQQLTKNALLTSDKTYKRKVEEFFLAREIEKEYSKDEILQMYLNRIYFGNGAWGIKRASQNYFSKEVEQLSISEAALLAGLIKAPEGLNPYEFYDEAVERRNTVLYMMRNHKFITEEEYKEAIDEEVALNELKGDPLRGKHPSYVDHVFEEAIKRYNLTQDDLLTGGFKIYTELDVNMQAAVEETFQKDELFPEATEEQIVQSGTVLIDPKSGGIRALAGGRDEHFFRGYNRATQLKAQPGSTMKPIAVFTPAIEEGWDINEKLKDEEMEFGNYKPSNYNGKYKGEVPMYEAVKDSLNIPAVWLLNEIGIAKGLDASKRFGIPLEKGDRNLALALGGLEQGVSPLTMAQAYSAFANQGVRSEAHAITKIVDRNGNIVGEWEETTTKVTSKETAAKMTAMLLETVEDGTGKGARIEGREIAGKTGSTQVPIKGVKGVKDQWFVGYSPELVGAIWVGFDKTDENHYLTTTSSEGAAKIFGDLMAGALQEIEPSSFNAQSIDSYIENIEEDKEKDEKKAKEEETKKEIKKEKDTEDKKKEKQTEANSAAEATDNSTPASSAIATQEKSKKVMPKKEKPKQEDLKQKKESKNQEVSKKEVSKKEEPKKEEPKKEEPKKEEPKKEEPKKEEPKKEEPKKEEPKKEEPKKEEPKKEEPKKEEPAEEKEETDSGNEASAASVDGKENGESDGEKESDSDTDGGGSESASDTDNDKQR
ncbi:transglycosylase domain-containing protein [Mesobacillus harenae]|uniref:transglycosylase domain-containing protein n=1 Tax=Mesobacillus harenae TaxID=2213203 RepID=UPI0018D6F82D|nr:PBP1A family penicillin-binding protein [Mesobacillus harenae]